MAKKSPRHRIGQAWAAGKGFSTIRRRWALLILVLIVAVFALTIAGYWAPWTGFGGYSNSKGEWQREKTLWDWMDLLLVPLLLALGAWLLNRTATARENEAEERRIKERQRIEGRHAREQQEIEAERAREAALQTYFDRMTELMKDGLRESEGGDVKRSIAGSRTLAVLRQLDAERRALLLEFLNWSQLINVGSEVVLLEGADLSRIHMPKTSLSHVYLEDVDLSGADLRQAFLDRTWLGGANLSEASLFETILREARLLKANLRGADLRKADLEGANLQDADLRDADLRGANLSRAFLFGANLEGAKVTQGQLNQADTYENAILPDGKTYTGKPQPSPAEMETVASEGKPEQASDLDAGKGDHA